MNLTAEGKKNTQDEKRTPKRTPKMDQENLFPPEYAL
jgi:hypothetical protein